MTTLSSSASNPLNRQPPATKGEVTVDVVEKPMTVSEESGARSGPTTQAGTALWDLVQGALLPCIPVVGVSAALLILILRHRVHLDQGWQMLQAPINDHVWDLNLQDWITKFTSTGGGDAYFIRYNPATLAAIASWISKIIPLITGASMGVGDFLNLFKPTTRC